MFVEVLDTLLYELTKGKNKCIIGAAIVKKVNRWLRNPVFYSEFGFNKFIFKKQPTMKCFVELGGNFQDKCVAV